LGPWDRPIAKSIGIKSRLVAHLVAQLSNPQITG
jgi:hypothetical protein